MYKKDKVVFASNLSEISFNDQYPIAQKRESYLLSEKYSSSKNVELANAANSLGRLIISDNGNFTRMSKVAGLFSDDCTQLLSEAKQLIKDNQPLTQEIFDKREALVNAITQAAIDHSATEEELTEILAKQFLIAPQYLIGFEDLTIPALILSGMMDEVFKPNYDEVHSFQMKTKALYDAQLEGKYGYKEELSKAKLYYVVHAYDYYSAFKVGEMMRDAPIEHFAVSYGGPMKSNRWRTHINWENHTMDLGSNYPEKYLLSQSIAKGFIDGVGRKVHLHILGCGSPIMLLLTGSLLPHLQSLTFDSSAPLKDAFDGNVYSRNLALTKVKIEKLVAYQLQKEKPYYTPDSFYQTCLDLYPHDWDSLGKALSISKEDDIKSAYKKVLSQPEKIREYLPFFSLITSGEEDFFETIRVLRSGCNYWMLRNICYNLREKVDDLDQFYNWIEKEVGRYMEYSNSKWGLSVKLVYDLTVGNINCETNQCVIP